MKIKNRFLVVLSLFVGLLGNAQEYKGYDWGKAESYKPNDKESNLGEIDLLNKTIKEFIIEKGMGYDYTIRHIKTYVNSDEAIENNNKVYIHFKSEGEEIITQKVRVIRPDGKTIELNESDVKEAENEETKVKYKYFAVRGLEKKCIVEQLTVARFIPKVNGKTMSMQNATLQKNVSYEFIYPKHLIFKFKSYNGLPDFKINDTIYKDKISSKIELNEVEALREEKYSNYAANVKKFSFKLSGNKFTNKFDLNNYKDYVTEIVEFSNKKMESKEQSALQKFVKLIPAANSVEQQIKNIENYIKTTISYQEEANTEATVHTTLTNKFSGAYGLLRLYKSVFNHYKINAEVVITSNRYKDNIDVDFESYGTLDQFVFYFPEQNGYIAPSEITARFPILPFKWTNCNAIFSKMIDFGGNQVVDFEIKKIETPSTAFTHDEMDIKVDFSTSAIKPTIESELKFSGYTALNFQPIYEFIDKDKVEEFEKELAENYCGKKENVVVSSENKGFENIGKPYVLKANYTGENLIEKAGDKILFKVGEIIGKQAELYQEGERQLPIDIEYPHAYKRAIKIVLPKGYKVMNADKLTSDFITTVDNKEVCKFATTYTMNANELVIQNVEYYQTVELSKEKYDSYIKVLNAAADFNKLVLVLQKS